MTPEQLDAQIELNDRKIASLTRYWEHALPSIETPNREQFRLWLKMFDFDLDVLIYAIGETAKKCGRLEYRMSADHSVRFCSKCAISFRKAKALPQLPAEKFVQRESYEVAA